MEACKPEEATQATLAQPSVKNDDEKLSETCRRHFQHVKLTDGRAAVPKLALLVPCVLAGRSWLRTLTPFSKNVQASRGMELDTSHVHLSSCKHVSACASTAAVQACIHRSHPPAYRL